MDSGTLAFVVVIVFTIVAVIGFLLYRGRVDMTLNRDGLQFRGENRDAPTQAVNSAQSVKRVIENSPSTQGQALAEDKIGKEPRISKAQVKDYLSASSSNFSKIDPKA